MDLELRILNSTFLILHSTLLIYTKLTGFTSRKIEGQNPESSRNLDYLGAGFN